MPGEEPTFSQQLMHCLKAKLTIEVSHASNDPEDDTRCVTIFYDEEEIASADL